jgi:hypothetical protein
MTAMLHDLVGAIAADLLAALPAPSPAPDSAALAGRLSAAGLLDREALVSQLLRRADEHRIASAFAGRAGPRKLPLLPRLVGDKDAGVAAAAMALVVARGRRRDAFGQPRIELNDLAAGEAAGLTCAIAAGLAGEPGDRPALAGAAEAVAAGYSAVDGLDAAVMALVTALEQAGRVDDAMVAAAAQDGEASLLAGLVARRATISSETAWGYLVSGQDDGLALLARMAGLGRPAAARLIAEFGALSGASVEEEIARFDGFADEEVTAALDWWRLPPDFRDASAALGQSHG